MALIWFRGASFTRLSCLFQSIFLLVSPLNRCTLNKKIVNWPPSLYSAWMVLQVGTVMSLCLFCGQDLPLHPSYSRQLWLAEAVQKAVWKCHPGTALYFIISPTICWWSFISLRFFVLTNYGKGLWSGCPISNSRGPRLLYSPTVSLWKHIVRAWWTTESTQLKVFVCCGSV